MTLFRSKWLLPLIALHAFPVSAELPSVAPKPVVKLALSRPVKSMQREAVTGSLFPAKGLQLGFEVGGRLEAIKVTKGEKVKEGQVLAHLNAEISDAQVAQAEAAVAAAEAASAMATDVAERNVKLMAEGSVSDVQSKGASTTSTQAAAQVLAARAGLAQAKAARKRHALRAPFSGTVIDVPDQIGGIVGPGVPLIALEQLDALVLKTTIGESLRASLKVGTKVKVTSVSGDASTDAAIVRSVMPSADPATRRIPVEILVPNADGRFVAHTLARADLSMGEAVEAHAIAPTALSSTGGDHVYVLDAEGSARKVAVRVVERTAKELVVTSAEPLRQVIDYPSAAIADGTSVSVK